MNNNIEELTAKVKARGKDRTPEEARELLQKARILDENGELTVFFQPKEPNVKELYEEFTKQAEIIKNRYFEMHFKYDSYMTVVDIYKKFKFTYWGDWDVCFNFERYDGDIPEKYFINTEEAFLELEQELQDRTLTKEARQEAEAIRHEQEDLAEYERLKIKFGGI